MARKTPRERITCYRDQTYGVLVRIDNKRAGCKSRATRALKTWLVEQRGWAGPDGLRVRTTTHSESLTHVVYRLDRAWYYTAPPRPKEER